MFCVGVAVRDFSNKVIAGLALSLLESEAVETNIEQVAKKLQAISLALSLRLGAPAGFGQCG
jgi:DNA-binding IclR family transcriptional regulator